eukprot:gene5354-7427_t
MTYIWVWRESFVTLLFSCLSLLGSGCVLLSYFVAMSPNRRTPRSAYLILQLAASDTLWFSASFIDSIFWVQHYPSGHVPNSVCRLTTPITAFSRIASLVWTSLISFNVLMSVQRRKWFLTSNTMNGPNEKWDKHRLYYYCVILLWAAPATILSLIKQNEPNGSPNLGCYPGYEPLGLWYEVFFTELLPLFVGFLFNLTVFLIVRNRMSKSAYPLSVRKRRKRIMYHYLIVCLICWAPTIIKYVIEILGNHSDLLELIARGCLYVSGFLNFLVFGLQDPHLKRSFTVLIRKCGLGYNNSNGPLRESHFEKSVMFEESSISANADLSKDKNNVYRYRKLSRADKRALYAMRPDLNPRAVPGEDDATLSPLINSGSIPNDYDEELKSSYSSSQSDSQSLSSLHDIAIIKDLVAAVGSGSGSSNTDHNNFDNFDNNNMIEDGNLTNRDSQKSLSSGDIEGSGVRLVKLSENNDDITSNNNNNNRTSFLSNSNNSSVRDSLILSQSYSISSSRSRHNVNNNNNNNDSDSSADEEDEEDHDLQSPIL